MSNDGKNILTNVKQIKTLFKDISLLLKTVDDKMEKEKWSTNIAGNTAISDGSSSILYPEKWIPSEIYRFYKNDNLPYRLAFVSVLLDDDREGEYKITEPLITAGYFDFDKNKDVGYDDFKFWYAKWYGYMENHQDNGQVISLDRKMEWQQDWQETFPFHSSKCFGWPLTSIANEKDVKSKIVAPLLELLSGEYDESK